MNRIVIVYKPIGLTPLQAIHRLQEIYPEYKNQTIGYAGRLDPMAEGLLLLLIGNENKKRKQYERLEKEYEFKILLGVETDSYDILGLVNLTGNNELKINNLELKINNFLNSLIGTWEQPYPPYSAARVHGKPLYHWALKGKIDQIAIPKKKITINSLELKSVREVKFADLIHTIIKRVKSVEGEFRQEAIISQWENIFAQHPTFKLIKISCTISCSSGTYVRSIAHSIGKSLEGGGVTLSIKRTKIGPYTLYHATRL